MNFSDFLASLANKTSGAVGLIPGEPETDLTKVISQVARNNPQSVPQMPFSMAPPVAQAGGVGPSMGGPQPGPEPAQGGYMGVGAGLASALPQKTMLPPPETEPTAPSGLGSPIATGSIAPSQPAKTPDFAPSFAQGLMNVGNALQGKDVADLNEGTLAKNATYSALLKKGVDPTTAEALIRNPALMQHALPVVFGGGKYGKQGTVFQDATGNFYTAQFAEDGTRKITPLTTDGQALEPSRGVKTVDAGTHEDVISGATGKTLRSIDKNVAQTEQQKVVGSETGKSQMALPKAEMALKQHEEQDKVVTDSIDKALTQASGWTTGFVGDWSKGIAGTPSHDLKNTLDAVRANLGFDKLQDMRNNSPTGGALGQVSEQENLLLQSVWGSIQQSQKKEQLVDNLNKIKGIREQYRTLKRQAYEADVKRFGAANVPNPETGQSPSAETPSAAPGQSRPRAVNPKTGQSMEFDGQNWIEVR